MSQLPVRWMIAAVALATAPVFVATAQDSRTLDVSRQLRDRGPHKVHVTYGAGQFELHPTGDPVLFAMQLRYNDANGTPLHRYDSTTRTLHLGIDGQGLRVGGGKSSEEGPREMHLGMSRLVPLDLDVDVGAARANLELGGLMLTGARIRTGAAETTILFSTPNASRLRSLDIELGAASVAAKGLANANTSLIHVKSGVGDVALTFDGIWTQSMSLDASVAVGKLSVRVPRSVGIRVDVRRVLGGFNDGEFEKRDGSYYSSNWDTALYKLTIRAETVLGALEIDRSLR